MIRADVAIALFLAFTGVFAPLLAPHDPQTIGLAARLCPPASCDSHVLGTDFLGRDLLSRIVTSFRMYLYIGLVGTVLGVFVAWLLVVVRSNRRNRAPSAVRPLFGGRFWLLAILTYIVGGYASLMVVSLQGPSLMLVIGCAGVASSILPMTLLYNSVRMDGATLSRNGLDVRQVIALSPVCFSLALMMGLLIESSLSFLGVGVPPSNPSLGEMISSGMRHPLAEAPWLWGFPLGIILMAVGGLSAIELRIGNTIATPRPGKVVSTEPSHDE